MSRKREKPKARKKRRSAARTPKQLIVTSAPVKRQVSRRKHQSTRYAYQPLIETSLYKVADLEGVKEEWTDKLLMPVVSGAVRRLSRAISYKPTDNVVAIGVGEKFVGGRPTGILALKFLVRSKKDRDLMLPKHLLPKSVRGLPVDVEQVGTFRAAVTDPNPRVEVRPARPGCSVGFSPPGGGSPEVGTFGALVRQGNTFFILSNNHVLADENNRDLLDAPIFQPALLDDPDFGNHQIATLTSFAELLHGLPNTIDCAIAEVTDRSMVSNSIIHIGVPSGTAAPFMGMSVHKFGRSSNYTVGSISMFGVNVRLEYDTDIFLFRNQIIIRSATSDPFMLPGDSGSLLVERATQRAVGLLIGINSDGRSGVANPITEVLNALDVTLA